VRPVSVKLPGPAGTDEEWNAFFEAFRDLAHHDLDMLDAVNGNYDGEPHDWESPWVNGGCGLLAKAVVEWMNDSRASWQVIARKGAGHWGRGRRDPRSWDYPHALIVYRRAPPQQGRIYFDAISITKDMNDVNLQWGGDEVVSRTRASNNHMAESFGCNPWDERYVELIRQTLLTHFGRWPRR
jgi:hypothetical protein